MHEREPGRTRPVRPTSARRSAALRFPLTTMTMFWKVKPDISLQEPCVPPGERLYAVGDLHGRLDLLDAMLDLIDADLASHRACRSRLIFLGDYVDRGPGTAQVIHRLIEVAGGYDATFLKGNHEQIMIAFMREAATLDRWRGIGGLTTLQSYGIAASLRPSSDEAGIIQKHLLAVMPPSHIDFFDQLKVAHVSGDYVFVHAGLRPGQSVEQQDEQDVLWIRDKFTRSKLKHEKFVIHGHTPVRLPDVQVNRINIDTGAYARGRLTCIILQDKTRRFLNT